MHTTAMPALEAGGSTEGWPPHIDGHAWLSADHCASSCETPRLELPLSQSCTCCGHKPPRFLFFAISGTLCNAAQLAMDRAIFVLLPEIWWAPTLCWTISYALSVALRHISHAVIVFGPHGDPPWVAVSKTYLAYLSTIIASTAINLALVAGASFSHELSLVVTASFSVFWSYLALSVTWKRTNDEARNPATK